MTSDSLHAIIDQGRAMTVAQNLHVMSAASSEYTCLADVLLRTARHHACNGVGVIDGGSDDVTLTPYPEMLGEAERVLGGLHAHQLGLGRKIALLLDHPSDFIPAFWACILGGYIPCPLVPIRNDEERWKRHVAYIDQLLERPLFISSCDLRKYLPSGVFSTDLETLRASDACRDSYQGRHDDIAALILTSGSTGEPKAVVLTHGNLLASMACKVERQRLTEQDVTLNWISFDHVAALLEVHLLALYVGAQQLHVEPSLILAEPVRFLRLISRHRVSMSFAPNFLFGQINGAIQSIATRETELRSTAGDLSCLRHVISGGEANVVETGHRFVRLLAPCGLRRTTIWPTFGMTETCAGSIYLTTFPDGEGAREFASLGEPVSGLELRVISESGSPVAAGTAGELQLRGPVVFSHYYNNEAATRAAFTPDGWFRTGDLARIEDGRLGLVGRNKDSIVVSGVNYFSQELEAALEHLSGVERSFVAVFPTRPKGADTEQLVITFATSFSWDDRTKMAQLMVGIRNTATLLWGFRPAVVLPLPREGFPKTSLGKIQRSLMRKRLDAGQFGAQQAYASGVRAEQLGTYIRPENAAEEAIAMIFAEVLGLSLPDISATNSFFELGGTSLEILQLTRFLTQKFVSEVSPAIVLGNPTVRQLAALLASQGRQAPAAYDPIVVLQSTGNRAPLFCVHPGNGSVLIFVNLAKYFCNERPFYALRPRGFAEGETCFSTFEEMTETYIAAIRRYQPRGPYAIAGYSIGSPIAFEVAKRLESSGDRVAFLGAIDEGPSENWPRGSLGDSAIGVASVLELIERTQVSEFLIRHRRGFLEPNACEHIFTAACSNRVAELDLDLKKFSSWVDVAHSLYTLVRAAHVTCGSVESLTVFCSRGSRRWREHLERWNNYSRTSSRYVDVDGEHTEIMDAKHVVRFQAVLKAELDRAGI